VGRYADNATGDIREASMEEAKLYIPSGGTPFTTADAVIRECNDKEWLEDVIFFLQCYYDRVYGTDTRSETENGKQDKD